jgi:hypothetical protein
MVLLPSSLPSIRRESRHDPSLHPRLTSCPRPPQVIGAYSAVTHPVVGKKLLELAGQSSLSMKPSPAVLLTGPALFLALEGTSHSILRLKSIFQQAIPGNHFSNSLGFSQVTNSHQHSSYSSLAGKESRSRLNWETIGWHLGPSRLFVCSACS